MVIFHSSVSLPEGTMKFTNCQRLTSPVMMGIKSSCRRQSWRFIQRAAEGVVSSDEDKTSTWIILWTTRRNMHVIWYPSEKRMEFPFYPRMISQIPWSKRTSDFVWLQLDPALKSAATTWPKGTPNKFLLEKHRIFFLEVLRSNMFEQPWGMWNIVRW